jgi:signal transduction histidine kinase
MPDILPLLGWRFWVLGIDLTPLRGLEKKLADQPYTILQTLITRLSDRFRNPVTTINTSLYLIQHDPQPEKLPARLEAIQRANSAIERMLIDTIILTRLEIATHRGLFDGNETIQNIIRKYAVPMEQKGITLGLDLHPAPLLWQGDEDNLFYALGYLLDNALKFTGKGGYVTVRSEIAGEWIKIAVQDSGIGIAAERLPTLFEAALLHQPQANRSARHGPRGLGLGLTIVQRIMHHFGGKVTVESVEGQGSTFTLHLPRSGANAAET